MATHITTPAELQAMRDDLTADYILDNDLDMTGVVWEPIGFSGDFTGTFDGQGFTISHLTVDDSGLDFFCCGLFGYCQGATIENVNFSAVTLIGNFSIGALAGYCDECTITNCTAQSVSISYGDDMHNNFEVGGLIGTISGGFTSDCSVDFAINFSINDDIDALGGFCGEVTNDASIENCSSSGNIIVDTGDPESFSYFGVGGFIGQCNFGAITLYNCSAQVSIALSDGLYFGVGGFIGQAEGFNSINKCFSVGSISLENGDNFGTGGFVGQLTSVPVTNCYAQVDVSVNLLDFANYGLGGFVGQSSINFGDPFDVSNCYSSGNVSVADNTDNNLTGGFVGQVYDTNIENCYSVGIVTVAGGLPGGFCGQYSGSSTFTNCSWWTGSSPFPFGAGESGSMESLGYGTDEDDNTAFYTTDHPVYAQGT